MAGKKAKPKPRATSRTRKPAAKAKPSAKAGSAAPRTSGKSASRLIDARIRSLKDWRGKTLAEVRRLIHEADPEIVEEWKWMGTPVWTHAGNVCTGETYKEVVKLTFAKGASLKDPRKLFNSSLDGNTRRAIDLREGETLNATAFQALIRAAVAENLGTGAAKAKSVRKASPKAKAKPKATATSTATNGEEVVLLSGGNPQIAKAYGDAPVQAYIAAMPGWKRDIGQRLDAIIENAAPGVSKAVKWNSPLYGIEGQGWFLGIHCFDKYVKIAFFRGSSLRPIPPGESRQKEVRYLDIREDEPFDEAQFGAWVKQASLLSGERM